MLPNYKNKILLIMILGIFILITIPTTFSNGIKKNADSLDITDPYRLNKFECKFADGICSTSFCNLTYVNSTIQYLNAGCNLLKKINNARVSLILYRRLNNKYQQFLVNVDENICDSLAHILTGKPQKSLTPSMDIIMGFISKRSNINHECPYKPSYVYFNKLQIGDVMKYKNLLPTGNYRANIRIYSNRNDTVLEAMVEFFIPQRMSFGGRLG